MRLRLSIILLILSSLFMLQAAYAQETPPIIEGVDTSQISDDQVNAIANQLYCPVCENIPLDTCGTAACDDWREEIRAMLASGVSEADIIDNFVTRFGDRVVSTPRDPIIAAISIVTPWLVLILAAGFALYQLLQWNQKNKAKLTKESVNTDTQTSSKRNSYLEQLEKDLTGK